MSGEPELTESETQCTNEIKALFHRWAEEGDLDDQDIVQCAVRAANEYYEDDVIDFDSEIDLDDLDDE